MVDRGTIRVSAVGATDVGRVRDHNEDNLLVSDLTSGERAGSGDAVSLELGERGLLLAVADGMGGAASGEIASETAVDTLFEVFLEQNVFEGEETTHESVLEGLDSSIETANGRIFKRGQEQTEHRGMGTTMTAAFALGDDLYLAQVGDSRAYLLRKGKLVQVTKDQSLISQLIEDGTLTEEDAEKLGGKNIILQALGVEEKVSVVSKNVEILSGDVLALCSDGLSGMIGDEAIQEVLNETPDLAQASKVLIEKANEEGGRDNITVVLARFEGSGLREPLQPLEVPKDKSGARPLSGFATPEMPTEKKNLFRPLLAAGIGVVLLVIILVMILTSGETPRNEMTFVFPAPGAEAYLISRGGEGERIPILLEPGETRHVLEGLEPGKYVLQASLPGYEDLRKEIEIEVGKREWEPPFVALPGSLKLVPADLHVAVGIVEVTEGVKHPFREDFVIRSPAPRVFSDVSKGRFRLVLSRPGFRFPQGEIFVEVGAGEDKVFELPPLTEIQGDLRIECEVVGAKVTVTEVTDEFQEVSFEAFVPEGKVLDARVRVGKGLRLSVVAENYRPFEEKDLEIEEGELTTVPVVMKLGRGWLKVMGPEGALVAVSGGPNIVYRKLDDTGEVTLELDPGSYSVEITPPGGESHKMTRTVQPGATIKARY